MFGWFKKNSRPQQKADAQQKIDAQQKVNAQQKVDPQQKIDEGPPGEAEKVMRIRLLCETAKWSARNVAELDMDPEMRVYEQGVYVKRRDAALELARELTDTFCRDAAFHSIIDLCMEGREIAHAKKLLDVVEVDMVRDKILEAYPELRARY